MIASTVSVVMSVFNGEAFLAEAVESILGQTLRDFEFVIIDDGSTDKTAEILSGYARCDARVRISCERPMSDGERRFAIALFFPVSRGFYAVAFYYGG